MFHILLTFCRIIMPEVLLIGNRGWTDPIISALEASVAYKYQIQSEENPWTVLNTIDVENPPDIIISEMDAHDLSGAEFYIQLHRKFNYQLNLDAGYDAPYPNFIFYFPFTSENDAIDLATRIGEEFPKPTNILDSKIYDPEKLRRLVDQDVSGIIQGYENEILNIKEQYYLAIPSVACGGIVTTAGGFLFYAVPWHPVALTAISAGIILTALSVAVTSIRNSSIKYFKHLINDLVSPNAS